MTEKEARTSYPEIDTLYKIIESRGLVLTVLPKTEELKAISFREIEFKSRTLTCIIPVDDEYEDAKDPNPAILLQLILHACYEHEDHDDITTWSTAYGLALSHSLTLSFYKTLGEVVPRIRDLIGTDLEGISAYDWQLNAGAAQTLRGLTDEKK